jgi:DNA-binding response OmpR family regulator
MMDQGPIRVLLVDDEESFVRVVALGLREEFGYDVTTASNGKEAIDLLRSSRQGFDVMVLDYMMPGVNGLDVLRWMHEDKNETPTFMLTAAGSETVAVEAMKLGAYDYCRKEQVDIQHLANLIKATHERHVLRVTRAIEEERAREILLNNEATDKVRDVINAITPTLNSALATISADFETRGEGILAKLSPEERRELRAMIQGVQGQVGKLEAGIRGLLAIYQLVYVRYSEAKELERIKMEFEASTNQASQN